MLTDLLSPEHLTMLRDGSSILDEVILARGYRTVTSPADLLELGFGRSQRRVPGLLLPLWPTDGGEPPLHVYRPDRPRTRSTKDGKSTVIKYEVPAGTGTRLDCPPACRQLLADPGVALWITEGQKKSDSLASRGLCAIALLGVWSWKSRNPMGGVVFAADWDYVALDGREVRIVFDSDVMTKPSVRQALARLTEHLQRKGASVASVYLPTADGAKVGVDDWLASGHTLEDLLGLIEVPRPVPVAAPPTFELLDGAPLSMRRPMALLDGRGYAATWLWVRTTRTEALDKAGNVVVLSSPEVTTERQMYVVRDDGALFGPGADYSLDEIGLDIALAEAPEDSHLWSKSGVMRFRASRANVPMATEPSPVDVFTRVGAVVDRFLDFDRSLADQATMAELIGAYILTTWFLDAFNVVGFLWPNGDRGAGKTKLLSVVASLAYLGELVTGGGSFAALRDLADYGAFLGFDDAEVMGDARQADPDKRALLLAGNRRGVRVPLKELASDKTWKTRWVNAFCARGFSAIRLPDPVLGSRSIVVPLIRSGDRDKANADPSDVRKWPEDRRVLLDDIWHTTLAHIAHLGQHEASIDGLTRVTGRNAEPWRALLSVAHWLDAEDTDGRLQRDAPDGLHLRDVPAESNGAQLCGLFARLEALSWSYQTERPELELNDMTLLVIRAMYQCTNVANVTNDREAPPFFTCTSAQIREAFDTIAEDEDIDIGWMSKPQDSVEQAERKRSQRIGHVLRALRLTRVPRARGDRSRTWQIKPEELDALRRSYGLLGDTPDLATNAHAHTDPLPNIGDIGYIGTLATEREIGTI